MKSASHSHGINIDILNTHLFKNQIFYNTNELEDVCVSVQPTDAAENYHTFFAISLFRLSNTQ